MFKIETHLHTKYSSTCSTLDASEIIRAYAEAGYSGICVTDHFIRATFEKKGIDLAAPGDKVTAFLEGYYRLLQAGQQYGILVYKGAELRFDGSANDYLLYNYPNWLLEDPIAVMTEGLPAFIEKSRKAGAFLVQAHPFREPCTPADPRYLDGVEIRNLHPRHESHNHLARQMAKTYNLISTCGSDCHQISDLARGGILVHTIPKDEAELVEILRSRNFLLLGDEIL